MDPLQLILQQAGLRTNYFSPSSRYYGLEVNSIETPTQGEVSYVKRRFISQPENFQTIREHTVSENERLDNITYQHLGDPEQFWRICDANAVMIPNDLTKTIGSKIRITMPEGLTGTDNAT